MLNSLALLGQNVLNIIFQYVRPTSSHFFSGKAKTKRILILFFYLPEQIQFFGCVSACACDLSAFAANVRASKKI